jgi:hypothetical protein
MPWTSKFKTSLALKDARTIETLADDASARSATRKQRANMFEDGPSQRQAAGPFRRLCNATGQAAYARLARYLSRAPQ